MNRKRMRRKKSGGAPAWMVTYSDMVTLILVFFILLFSMSKIDNSKFDTISESFRSRMILDFLPSAVLMENPAETTDIESGNKDKDFDLPTDIDSRRMTAEEKKEQAQLRQKKAMLNAVMTDIDSYLQDNNLTDVITAERTDRGIQLTLQESLLFASGQAEILKTGEPFLNTIAGILVKIPNKVTVEGHTDNRPISNYRYPSNWELSGARASSVIRFLINQENFAVDRFSSVGYGDTRPIAPNNSTENWSKNRRVEIVILEEDLPNNLNP